MTLTQRLQMNGRKANRERQQRAERRLDEIVRVAGIANDYQVEDRRGDLAIETHFARLFQLVDGEAEKRAVADAYVTWQKSEQAEDLAVIGSVGESVHLLKTNNDYWLDGASVPGGSEGAA